MTVILIYDWRSIPGIESAAVSVYGACYSPFNINRSRSNILYIYPSPSFTYTRYHVLHRKNYWLSIFFCVAAYNDTPLLLLLQAKACPLLLYSYCNCGRANQ